MRGNASAHPDGHKPPEGADPRERSLLARTRSGTPEGIAPGPASGQARIPSGMPDGHPAREPSDGHLRLAEVQRARILSAMAAVASEHGVGYATVARVVARSGVSRRTFYEHFVDREHCFLAAFDQALARVAEVVVPAYEQAGPWRAKIRGSLRALLEFLDREPTLGRLLIVESLGVGPRALERRQNVQLQILPILDQGQVEAKRVGAPPPLTAEGILGGVLSLIHARMLVPRDGGLAHRDGGLDRSAPGASGARDAGDSLLGLLNPLMAIVVLPYLGPSAARRELTRPVPPSPNGAVTATADPLRDLDMRLTYRTLRVLLAIGELGGRGSPPSNRQVGDASGIRDQGQVSKLLSRLTQLGLVENAGEARAKGEPNKWRLTKRGSEVREAISP
jgi:AcrR family transcriptional regulator